MVLEKGTIIQAVDVHGAPITGIVECFGERTVICSDHAARYVVAKRELEKQGYTFPLYKVRRAQISLS